METITKTPIKKFAKISFIYGLVCSLLFIALLIVALMIPKSATTMEISGLIIGNVFCLILCLLVIWHYCVRTIYEVQKSDDKVIFCSHLKKWEITAADTLTFSTVGSGFTVKINSANSLHLYNSLGFSKDLFVKDDIRTIMSWREK